jgi:hypothetical protein
VPSLDLRYITNNVKGLDRFDGDEIEGEIIGREAKLIIKTTDKKVKSEYSDFKFVKYEDGEFIFKTRGSFPATWRT